MHTYVSGNLKPYWGVLKFAQNQRDKTQSQSVASPLNKIIPSRTVDKAHNREMEKKREITHCINLILFVLA